jgi:hypothetical protein
VDEFRKLTKGAIDLAPARDSGKVLKGLDHVQKCASGLYDKFRDGYKCQCSHTHPANIKLDVWVRMDIDRKEDRLKFKFLFADDAQHAEHDHWMTAEVTHSKSPGGAGRPLIAPTTGSNLTGKSTCLLKLPRLTIS